MIGEKIILGNLMQNSILDIWFSEKSLRIRKQLGSKNRNFSPCNVCDVDGTLMGQKIRIFYMKRKILILGGNSDIGKALIDKLLKEKIFICTYILIKKT